MMTEGPIAATIRQRLRVFEPRLLEIIDESAQHHGHAGAHQEGESHFRLRMVADTFNGQSRLACHRMVHAALEDLLASRIHALVLELRGTVP